MSRSQRAILLQLPAPDFRWPRLDTNLPLAAGYLAAAARAQAPSWDVEVLPWTVSDVLGDPALEAAIVARSPDLVGFSLYLWNVERSAHLARRLARHGIRVVAGGPEAAPGSPWHGCGDVPWQLYSGEGEAQVAALLAGASPLPQPPAADLSRLPSPYLEGILAPYPDGTVWLETVRGCPFSCLYCNYGRHQGAVRRFPATWLRRHLAWAARAGAREVYLMDPSFNVRRDWQDTLESLEEARAAGLSLHTELVADQLQGADARRLAGLGLRSCEVGLQSADPAVLAAVGRPWDPERWTRGVRALADAGVAVTVGLIAGLPGDSPDGVRRSVEFVRRRAPQADVQLFPLALLPGTRLRAQAGELGLRALSRPPYTVLETPSFAEADLVQVFQDFEATAGLELDPMELPALTGADTPQEGGSWLSGVRLEAAGLDGGDWWRPLVARVARSLTVWIRGWHERLYGDLADLAGELRHGVLTLVIEDGAGWDPARLLQLLRAVGSGDHFLDRHYRLLYGIGARLVPRLSVLLTDGPTPPPAAWLAAVRSHADLLWAVRVGPAWQRRVARLAQEDEVVLVRGTAAAPQLAALAARLGAARDNVLFENLASQRRWLALAGETGHQVAPRWEACP